MRMRKKKHGAERIAACRELLIEQPSRPGPAPPAGRPPPLPAPDPQTCFPLPRPLHVEIGCG